MACADQALAEAASGPQAWLIDDGARLHLQHGPIDLIIHAVGQHAQVQRAYRSAVVAFEPVLHTLANELPLLRCVLKKDSDNLFHGSVAQRMQKAVAPYTDNSVTPMIAVAGAVADHVLSHMLRDCQLDRVMVNNGGDIALHLSPGVVARVGICTDLINGTHTDVVTLSYQQKVGGVATSGWRGRSHSLGIADAVTVLAGDAASADVAATLIANAVDIPDCASVKRQPACELAPDSDLLDQLVTVQVGYLSASQIRCALNAGAARARRYTDKSLVHCAYLHLQGKTTLVGVDPRPRVQPVSHAS